MPYGPRREDWQQCREERGLAAAVRADELSPPAGLFQPPHERRQSVLRREAVRDRTRLDEPGRERVDARKDADTGHERPAGVRVNSASRTISWVWPGSPKRSRRRASQ